MLRAGRGRVGRKQRAWRDDRRRRRRHRRRPCGAGAWRACRIERCFTRWAAVDADGRDTAAAAPKAERARWLRGRRFLEAMYEPAPHYRVPRGDTIVCRCEEVTAQQIADCVKLGCPGPNQMKSYLRCGMGLCQGRLCGLTVTELIARERGVQPGRGRLLPAALPDQADHARRAGVAAAKRRFTAGRCALGEITRLDGRARAEPWAAPSALSDRSTASHQLAHEGMAWQHDPVEDCYAGVPMEPDAQEASRSGKGPLAP